MSDKAKYGNRIPFETIAKATAVSPWSLPQVEGSRRIRGAGKDAGKPAPQQDELIEEYRGNIQSRPLTAESLQQITQEAKREGHEQGYREGLEQGLSEGREKGQQSGHDKAYKHHAAELQSAAATLQAVCDALLPTAQQQTQALEKIVVDMAIHLAKNLVARELQASPEWIVTLVQRALQALPPGSENISVFLAQEDARLLEQHLPSPQRQWRVQVDAGLQAGSVRVETAESLVDYSIATRLDNYLAQVSECRDGEATPVLLTDQQRDDNADV